MGLLGGDCPEVAWGGPPTRVRRWGTPGEARQPPVWQDPPFGCQPKGGQERDSRRGRARGRRRRSHPGTGHWKKGPRAGRDSPPAPYQGTRSPCRKIGEGSTALPGQAAGSGAALSSNGHCHWEDPFSGVRGKGGPPQAQGAWQGLGDRVSWQGRVPGTKWHPGSPHPPAGRAQ